MYSCSDRKKYIAELDVREREAASFQNKRRRSRTEKLLEEYKKNGFCKTFPWFFQRLGYHGKRVVLNKVKKTKENDGLALDHGYAGDRAELYFSDVRIAVYMALFGSYDRVWEPLTQPDNVDYFIITDQEVDKNSCWKSIPPENVLPEEIRGKAILCNRWCKMHPHLLFPSYEESVYVDSSFQIVSDLTPMTARLKDYPISMFRHKKRDCVYMEIETCIQMGKDEPEALLRHKEVLEHHGVPRHSGLLEAPVIARRHNDPRCIDLMDQWWDAFCRNSKRDQISFRDVLWVNDIDPRIIGVLGSNVNNCPLLNNRGHVKTGV